MPNEQALGSRDDIRVHGGLIRRWAGAAAEGTPAVHERACDPGAFTGRGGHGHGHAQYVADLHEAEDQDQEQRRKDERELDQPLRFLAPEEADHSCGSARVMVVSVNVTLFPAKRMKLVAQKCWYVTRTPMVSMVVWLPPQPARTLQRAL